MEGVGFFIGFILLIAVLLFGQHLERQDALEKSKCIENSKCIKMNEIENKK